MKIIAIIQARMSSSRLPGKVLLEIGNRPMLEWVVERTRRAQRVNEVVIATTIDRSDDPVFDFCIQNDYRVGRGSVHDVLDRYYQAAKIFKADYVIRATGDNPLVDIEEACRVRDTIKKGVFDYVTGVETVEGVGLPVGVGVEAFSLRALELSWQNGNAPNHREHVNEYILENQDFFMVMPIKCLRKNSCPELRLTIDTDDDFIFVEKIIASIDKPPLEITTEEIIEWWTKNKKQ